MENILDYNNFISLNEGKAKDVERFGSFIKYHNEVYPGLNFPKRYIGKGKYKYRVLAQQGDTVKPINFGDVVTKQRLTSRLSRKYWESLPIYK